MIELLGILATYRLTSLLHYEEGPFRVFERLRLRVRAFEEDEGGRPVSFLGGLVSCFACLSVWAALIPAMSVTWLDIIAQGSSNGLALLVFVRVLAYSAGAMILDRLI